MVILIALWSGICGECDSTSKLNRTQGVSTKHVVVYTEKECDRSDLNIEKKIINISTLMGFVLNCCVFMSLKSKHTTMLLGEFIEN